jgi:hypothetical protein
MRGAALTSRAHPDPWARRRLIVAPDDLSDEPLAPLPAGARRFQTSLYPLPRRTIGHQFTSDITGWRVACCSARRRGS